MLESLWLDLRYALRQLARAPVLTFVASASIAVGIAVAVGAFSFFNGVLLKPLPVPDADGVYHIYTSDFDGSHEPYGASSYRDYEDFAATGAFTGLAAVRRPRPVSLAIGSDPPTQEYIGFASANYFDVLRLPLQLGRGFSTDALEPTVVLTHTFWQRRLNGDPDVLGRPLRVNGVTLTIAGVAPARFRGTEMGAPSAGWIPARLLPVIDGDPDALMDRRVRMFNMIGRLAPQQTRAATAAQLNGVARSLAAADPEAWIDRRQEQRMVSVLTHAESVAPPGQRGELVLVGIVCTVLVLLLLLLVCTNVASLLVARAIARRREIAVRLALGASRRRLLRQLFAESVLLALVGGGLGLTALLWTLQLAERLPLADPFDLQPDWRVLAAALGFTILSALLFGTAPALHATRTDVRSGLGSAAVTGERSRLRGILIATQVAVSCLLILLAVTAARGARAQLGADPGVPVDGALIARLNLVGLADSAARSRHVREVIEVIETTPGVRHVARTTLLPFGNVSTGTRLRFPDGIEDFIELNVVDPDYFAAVRVRTLEGRVLEESDRVTPAAAAVVNRAFRRAYPRFGVGTAIDIGSLRGVRIVGVVDDIRYHPLPASVRPLVYLPADPGVAPSYGVSLIIAADPASERPVAAALRQRIQERFSDHVTPPITSLRERLASEALPQRIGARVALGIGAVELVLAAVGLYGLLLFALLARTREIGVRLALGAAPRAASWAIVRSGLRYAAIGAAAGIGIGVPAVLIAARSLPGARAGDPLPFLAAVVAVATAAALAALVPALRAARIQPAVALREE